MKANYDTKRHASILRDTLVQSKPHTLERPKRSPEIPQVNSQRRIESPLQGHTPGVFATNFSPEAKPKIHQAQIPAVQGQAGIDRFSEAIELAKSEGLRIGREQGLKEGRSIGLKEFESQLGAERKRIFDDAFKEGREQGLLAGKEEGLLHAEKELSLLEQELEAKHAKVNKDNVHRFSGLSQSFTRAYTSQLERAEDDMLEICFGVISKIVGEQSLTRDGLLSLIQQHRKSFLGVAFRVGLHPSDFQMIVAADSKKGEQTSEIEYRLSEGVTLYSEPSVETGGAVLHNHQLTIDARLELQLKKFADAIMEARASESKDSLENKNNA